MTKLRQLKRVTTGIAGLDQLLAGGLFETGVYIVHGTAGAGKTLFANQICFHLAASGQQAVYYTLLSEAHDRMLGFIQDLAFFDPAQVSKGVKYVSGFKVLEIEGLAGVMRSIRDTLARERPTLIAVDGLVTAEDAAPSNTELKKFLHELQSIAGMFTCTMLLLTNTSKSQSMQAESTMVDGIFELQHETVQRKPTRTLEISKFRGAGQLRGTHTLSITDRGLTIYPRSELVLRAGQSVKPAAVNERRGFGVAELDRAIGGGLMANSNTMLLGPSGIGKTVLCMHFLNAGAIAGERAILFTFYERPDEVVVKARRLGMEPLARAIDAGTIEVVWQSSVEAKVDIVGANLVSTFEALQPKRVVVDGMHGFQVTEDHTERIQDFFAALSDFFMARGATLVFTAESPDFVGEPLRPPFANASRMCHNIVTLRYSEVAGRLLRAMAVIKTRDADFDSAIREFVVTVRGVEITGPIEGRDNILVGQSRSSQG